MPLKISLRSASALAVMGLALGLAGCGSSHHSKSVAPSTSSGANSPMDQAMSDFNHPSSSPTLPLPVNTPAQKSRPVAAEIMPDWNTPASDYVSLATGNDIMFQYYAHTGISPNYKTIATNFDHRYANTSDVFTQHKILKEIKPIIDQRIASAKQHPYVYWPMYNLNLGNYSFKRHGFSTSGTMLFGNGSQMYYDTNSSFSLELRNGQAFSFLPVKNQKLAQKIEHYVSQDDTLYVQPYMFVNGASLSSHEVRAIGIRINVYGPQKQLLLSYAPHHS